MSIFLLILKIIGIILLVLIGLVFFLVLLVLFCPFSYRAKGAYQKEHPDIHAKVFWLFGLLAVCVDVTDESVKYYMKICGIRRSFSRKMDNSEDFADNTNKTEASVSSDHGLPDVSLDDVSPDDVSPDDVSPDAKTMEAQEVKSETSSNSFFDKIQNVRSRTRNMLQSLKHMFSHGKETAAKISSLWENESCKEGIKFIVRKILSFLGRLKPRKFRLNLSFSTGSPDTTGELLGVLAMIPMAYQNRWEIIPDFASEDAYADASFDIFGWLFGFRLLQTVVGIILDKNCRKLYNRLMR